MSKQKKFEGVRNENGSEKFYKAPILMFPSTKCCPNFLPLSSFLFPLAIPPHIPHPCLTIQQWNFLLEWGNDTAKRKIIKMGVTPLL